MNDKDNIKDHETGLICLRKDWGKKKHLYEFFRVASWFTSDQTQEKDMKSDLANIFKTLPDNKSICFVDMTFFEQFEVDPSGPRAVTIIMTPNKECGAKYKEYLKKDFLEKGNTLAGHEYFISGLRCEGDKVDNSKYRGGIFYSSIGTPDATAEDCQETDEGRTDEYFIDVIKEIYKGTYVKISEISKEPFTVYWTKWSELFEKNRKKLSSKNNLPLHHLVAFPVGFFDEINVDQFTLIGAIFLGFDHSALSDEEKERKRKIADIHRYFTLELRAIAARQLLDARVERKAREASFAISSHELIRIIPLIGNGTCPLAHDDIRHYFNLFLGDGLLNAARKEEQIQLPWLAKGVEETAQLSKIVEWAIQEASHLDCLSRMAHRDDDRIQDNDQYIKQQTSTLEEVKKIIRVDVEEKCLLQQLNDMNVGDPKYILHWFGRAVIAAMRNMFQHTYREKEIKVFVEDFCLVITNYSKGPPRRKDGNTSQNAGGRTVKTEEVLRACVRNYKQELGKVSMKLLETKDSDSVNWEISHWETRFPLPIQMQNEQESAQQNLKP